MTRSGERDLAAQVVAALSASKRGPLKAKELSRTLRIPTHEYRRFRRLLTGLEKAGRIHRVRGNRYQVSSGSDLVSGPLSVTRRGDGFVRSGGGAPDVFVPARSLGNAMEGDRVVARVEDRPRGRSPVGSIVDILARSRTKVVGTFHFGRRSPYIVPLDSGFGRDVVVAPPEELEPREGDVVVARILSYGDTRVPPRGEVEEILGPLGDPGVDVLAVAHSFGLSLDFPPEVLTAAEEAARAGQADPGPARVDRTDLLCFTIDPADAKDHDDALSLVPLEDGLVQVGVHIADVSHFVRPTGAVNAEALARGTSVYLVDRAIPMLPPVLSSDVCSLKQDTPRFAISLFLTLDDEARVHERRYERTLIRCRHALSYETAQDVLEGRQAIDPDLDEALRSLDDRARGIRAERRKRGALDLDVPEADVRLDDDGVPIDVRRRERHESHRLIEDYMILANEVVANDLASLGPRAMYRVHEPPAKEDVQELTEALAPFGLEVPRRKSLKPKDIQAVLERAREEERAVVSNLVLRTLKKARYDTENLGHFGLASGGYTHFTSPIRRYPDLVVHRLIAAAFLEDASAAVAAGQDLESVAEQSSLQEQAAEEAERATVALKKVEFMEQHLGESFTGRVTGVAPFGLFVTLDEYFVEGLVHVRTLEDDYYRPSAGSYALVGEGRGRRYALGDRLEVQVVRADKEARHIDFLALGRRPRVD